MSAFGSMQISGKVRTLVVVLGDQLDQNSAAFEDYDDERDGVLMMEVENESRHVESHTQRTVLFLSAMRHFALELAGRGKRVRYVTLDQRGNTGSFDGEVERAVKMLGPERIRLVRPGEWRVLEMAESWEDLGVEVEIVEDGHFYTTPDDFGAWAEGRKELTLEYFYRAMRRKLGVLVDDDGEPEGGEWNYDKENREAFKKAPDPPRPYFARPDDVTREVMELVEKRLGDLPGRMERFRWPVTRDEAKRALKSFIENRLAHFGTHQDAMWEGEAFLNHSVLSTSLNLKLLDPRECVDAAVEAYERGDAPLNSVEGFVRQLIGWREFIRGVYWTQGSSYGDGNALRQYGDLPELYWTGETEMNCMKHCVGEVLDNAYGHHIQRLMVTGNFALISGVHPRAVTDWYLGMYADAVDWVTLPNTLGMAMHADGGVVGSKPYCASGKYIKRMSNYCDGCAYDVNKRTGEDACPFNTFYWDFLIRNHDRFKSNRRMAMILKNVDRLDKEERVEITSSAKRLRDELGIGGVSGGSA